MPGHVKLFEAGIDPYGEENWEERNRILYPVQWYLNEEGGQNYAMVGDLLIGNYFKPSIERILKNMYHIRVGLGLGELHFVKEKFRTAAECQGFIENWWNEFAEKISFER